MKKQLKLVVESLETRVLPATDLAALIAALAPPSYSVDGTGNNAAHPTWGSAGADLVRSILPAKYGDGVSTPNGQNLPSARAISNAVGAQTDEVLDSRDISAFTYAWGQFIDHDLDHTPDGGDSVPITVPAGDPQFDPNSSGNQTLPFTRSITDPATGTSTKNPLDQITDVTSFIDGSMVYGSDPQRAAELRTFQGGTLKTSPGNLMPFNSSGLPNANNGPYPNADMFLGGDIRANENIELTSLQTLFMREHNYWAGKIAAANPSLNDEQIFQAARSIVIGEIQSITYNQFLPAILGQGAISPYRGYNARVNPGISAEFSEAAFRFGHSQLDDDVQFFNKDGTNLSFTFTLPDGTQVPVNAPDAPSGSETGISLVDAFFDPYVIEQPGVIDSIFKYLSSDVAQAVDGKMVDSVRNILFGAPGSGAGGQDLFALDIQRGRDVGLPTYNQARVAYGLPAVTSFKQISSDPTVQKELQTMYGNVNNVELFVGGLVENHAPGSSMGATFRAIVANQFERVRDGDSLWYQNIFKGAALTAIQNTTLADIITRNTSDMNLQKNVFVFNASVSGTVFGDANANGVLGRGDFGIPGVPVKLVDSASGEVVAQTRTNFRGDYSFNVTSAGSYQVQVTLPAGITLTTAATQDVPITSGDQFVRQLNFGVKLSFGGRTTSSTPVFGPSGGQFDAFSAAPVAADGGTSADGTTSAFDGTVALWASIANRLGANSNFALTDSIFAANDGNDDWRGFGV